MKPSTDHDLRVLRALAHPLRVRIMSALEERVASPSELSEELQAPLGNVSYHVRILHQLKLIKLVRRTPRRGAVEHHYRAIARAEVSDAAWAQAPATIKEALLAGVLKDVGGYVNQAAGAGGFDRADAHLTRTQLRLDDEAWKELAAVLMTTLARVDEIQAASAEREHDGGQPVFDVGVVLMQFEAAPAPVPEPVTNGRAPRARRTPVSQASD